MGLTLKLFNREILALDWDQRQVRAIAAQAGTGRLSVKRMFSESVPQTVSTDDPGAFGVWLRGVLARHGCAGARTLVALPRDRVVLKNLSVPPVPDEELAALVQFQMQKELPFAANEAVIDYTVGEHLGGSEGPAGVNGGAASNGAAANGSPPPVAPAATNTELLVAATRREVVDYYTAVMERAGLTAARIGLRCFCNLRTLRTCLHDDACLLMVDVGPAMTEINVVRKGTLLFSRSASVQAARPDSAHDAPESREFMDRLNLEVLRSVQAARATVSGLEVEGVVVAAPMRMARPIADLLSQRLEVPGRILDPSESIHLPRKQREQAGEFSAVIGLAMGHMDKAQPPFDFLHPHKPVDLNARRRRKKLLVGGAVAAGLLLCIVANAVAYSISEGKVNRKDGELAKLKPKAKAVRDLADQVKAVTARAQPDPEWLTELERLNQMWVAGAEPQPTTAPEDLAAWKELRDFHSGIHVFHVAAVHKDKGEWTITLEGLADNGYVRVKDEKGNMVPMDRVTLLREKLKDLYRVNEVAGRQIPVPDRRSEGRQTRFTIRIIQDQPVKGR
ncbi:MAG: hypothetical protein BIFFINMI_01125 [Phycisphaerae bacterium]|nr:hypothetical protein [Phycisphaerae bacterium]